MSVVAFTLCVLTIYLIGLKIVSYFAYRLSEKTTEDYFVANRGVGLFALVATTTASLCSTGTVVAHPSEFFTKGSSYFWIFFFLMVPIIMLPFATRIAQVGKVKGFITPGQMLGDYFQSKAVQIVAGFIGLVSMVPYAAAQMVAIGKTFDALTAGVVPYEVGISIVTIAIAMYVWYGGSRAVIWTDAVQGVIFAALLVATGFLAVKWAGGWELVIENLKVEHREKTTFDIGLQYYEMIPLVCSFFFLPYVWQRSYMAKSTVKLAKTIVLVPVIFAILFFVTWVIGTSALVKFPDGLADGDSVLGALFNQNAPYFGAIFLVAAFAAGMSTVDSQLLSAGSILTHDIKRKIIKRRVVARLRWRDNYKFARVATMVLLMGIYIWALTLQNQSVVVLIILGISINVVFLPILFGLFFWKRSSAAGALWAMILGIAAFGTKGMTPLGEFFPTELNGASWALIVSSVVFVALSFATSSERLMHSRIEYRKILAV